MDKIHATAPGFTATSALNRLRAYVITHETESNQKQDSIVILRRNRYK